MFHFFPHLLWTLNLLFSCTTNLEQISEFSCLIGVIGLNNSDRALKTHLNIYILHQLRNKFLQLILISLNSASSELHQYSNRMYGPLKKSQSQHPLPRNRTWDLKIARLALYLTTKDTTNDMFVYMYIVK